MTFKKKIFHLIDEKGKNKNPWNRTFDIFIITLIFLSITEVILESYQDIEIKYQQQFRVFESFVVLVFSIEYLLRLWTADLKYPKHSKFRARITFLKSPMGLIDLMAILPFYLPLVFAFDLRFIRVLRVFRLLRIFKLNRYTKAMRLVGSIFFEKRVELSITIMVTFILLLWSSTLMYHLEHDVQPEQFPNIIETFWWAIATLTTVGYGDVYPVTGWGKLISGLIALLGIGLVALPTGIISAAFIERLEENMTTKKDFKYCPHCGEKLD